MLPVIVVMDAVMMLAAAVDDGVDKLVVPSPLFFVDAPLSVAVSVDIAVEPDDTAPLALVDFVVAAADNIAAPPSP